MVKIFIDPGHGGDDAGAEGNGLVEKDLVLTISLEMQSILNRYQGVEVQLSREDDRAVGLSERAQMANDWEADYFISVHVNAGGGSGFESYVHPNRFEETEDKRETMHRVIVNTLDVTDRGEKEADFAVLRETEMSAILTENLFVDNDEEAEKLSNPSFLTEIAQAHVDGLVDIFDLEEVEGNDQEDDVLYIVQVGAFENEENAKRLAEELEAQGYETHIRRETRS
ncbi:N-acetylmuramoyl-L-alanine amidase [Alkalihalobacterium chitinilyticum]|uniref:N-acetylmuramoyl-L-alanine amidase n=1 Tax=Alkalihalobacterium chitinilyticum TaxID=2980103 RepID=A0ABT5VDS9_9BACI|nr:N-acetylmuramoyl-L-alanine amidase [Alkalihalobacterium chitinilyticum]MDE5413618.1 N-acetylmuramoyl-L-alanine amidase [Alkalihalobacterium chitinilyticum]